MEVIYAPDNWTYNHNKTHIFLAGSIEGGKAEKWQDKMIEFLGKQKHSIDFVVLNPRRKNWKDTEEDVSNSYFTEQVNWELDSQEKADLIIMYFDPKTKSPISLLELGLFCGRKNMIVYCPKPYWKKGNVDIVCERYEAKLFGDKNSFARAIIKELE